jgi:hypothetical protein
MFCLLHIHDELFMTTVIMHGDERQENTHEYDQSLEIGTGPHEATACTYSVFSLLRGQWLVTIHLLVCPVRSSAGDAQCACSRDIQFFLMDG